MNHRSNYTLIVGFVVCALFAPVAAHAYLDAGTGSYLIQLVIAFIAGGLFMVKAFWRKLWSVVSHDKKTKDVEIRQPDEKQDVNQPDQS